MFLDPTTLKTVIFRKISVALALAVAVFSGLLLTCPTYAAEVQMDPPHFSRVMDHCPLHHQKQVSAPSFQATKPTVSHAADASPVFCHIASASSKLFQENSNPFIPHACCYDHHALLSSGMTINCNPDIPDRFFRPTKTDFISRLPDSLDRPPWA